MNVRLLAMAVLALGASGVAQEAADDGLSYVVRATPDDPILDYAWDDEPLRGLSVARDVRLTFGEAQRSRHALAYVSYNTGPTRIDGRFGPATTLREVPGSLVVPLGRGSNPRTVSLWLRPDEGAKGTILTLPGLLTMSLDESSRVRLRLESDPVTWLVSDELLAAERWTHVAFSLDADELRLLRLVVDGEWKSAFLRDRSLAPRSYQGRLVLGRVSGVSLPGYRGGVDELWVGSQAETTAELLERGRLEPPPGMHTLTIKRASGSETLELWSGLQTESVLDTEDAWRNGALEHALPTDTELAWVPGHWERVRADAPPLARTTHANVSVGGGRIFLFGGETRDTHVFPMVNTNDTWIFDTRRETWKRILGDVAPSPRCHQSAAYSPDHDLVFYAGGFAIDAAEDKGPGIKNTRVFADTWVFHTDEMLWEERAPAGLPINDCAVVYHPGVKKFVVVRRWRVSTYDPATDRWELLPPGKIVDAHGAPLERFAIGGSPVHGIDPATNEILLFGGELDPKAPNGYTNHTLRYSLETNTFQLLTPESAPSPRVRAAMAHDSKRGRFVLFGGVRNQYSQRNRDLWVFDPAEGQWTSSLAANAPSARGGYYGMCYEPKLDRFFLLCGRHSQERFLNEVWSLALDEDAEGRAGYVFDRAAFDEGPAARDRWFARRRAPEGSSVSFRFRASADGARWSDWGESPSALATAEARFLHVELTLRPGPGGAAPSVSALGFAPAADVAALAPEDGVEVVQHPVTPLR